MERCILCGGRLAEGKCTECGLDNTKNDKKYHLNTHNDNKPVFHSGRCEDNLNRENKKNDILINAQKSPTPQEKRKREKKVRERRQAGTVRGGGRTRKLLRAVIFFVVLIEILSVAVPVVQKWVMEQFDSYREPEDADFSWEDSAAPRPDLVAWDETVDGYFELELDRGRYEVGSDIPAGEYQITCQNDTANIFWQYPPYDFEEWIYLSSVENQKDYEEYTGEASGFYEASEIILLEDGASLMVETCESGLMLKGVGEGADSLKPRKAQGLSDVILEGESFEAGEDFTPGVYDIELEEGEYTLLDLNLGENTYIISLYERQPLMRRISFEEGDQMKMDADGETKIRLVPSF